MSETARSGRPAQEPVTVAVVDNHELILDAVAALADRHPQQLRRVERHLDVTGLDLAAKPPDVVVLDLYLGRDDRPCTQWIPRLAAWGTRVLVHTSSEFPVPVREAVAAGAAGLCLKNDGSAALLEAIREVAAGDFACSGTVARALLGDPELVVQLTRREIEVIRAIDDGLTHRQIGRRHDISEETVRAHLKAVRAKYMKHGRDIGNPSSVVREARRDGYVL